MTGRNRPGGHDGQDQVPVVVIGAGPTGVTAAILLAQNGIPVLVLERWPTVYPQPRAVHLDDEVHRILGWLGVADVFAQVSRPAMGLRLLDGDLNVLAEFRRGTAAGRHGFPQANMFEQPELEGILRDRLAACPQIALRGDSEVTGISQDDDGVTVTYTDLAAGDHASCRARYVLGCDGANSFVRTGIGARMRDLRFEQRWLVVDAATDADLRQWDGVHQVCDRRRAATYMRIGATRYRWEFQLLPGETSADYQDPDKLLRLLAPWTGAVAADELEPVRIAEYTFRAQIADRWRDRRVFLLGDAAHLTPPFIGQGMGAGLRDAANLSWKLAAVLHGALPESILDTYEAERRPHARIMILMAKAMGIAMTSGGEIGTLLRRVIAPHLNRVPGFSRFVLDSRTPALSRTALVARPLWRRGLAGTLCPNAALTDGLRVDDIAAGRYTIVATTPPTPEQEHLIDRRGGCFVTAEPGTDLHGWLRRGRAAAVLVRPDGTVARTGRDLGQLCAALPDLNRTAFPVQPSSSL
ncbi:bifunctional 3-(3-hydroxy-phenyl)propionate/3-hydroxycinnamic acid hydroxylase MhpA [Actinomadura latina]|uniref:Bifunctional 3-(3-hydroxy-phenyl)propionate/3-hydroxycinnamic acid hydroxylase n=1 Tax=Actinomadura latina TaxID=163603 RepID=A0A846Z4N5_9ACTN|nr:bifunctional 3-(3-hydroxy-phenyl)propionate/3-hydroxycinnamic acid hydroxylase [Actinomadura latina]NKZ07211.1 bifunctional 3-(3-hydroxy-phenyl)propionate/3-hydroxycinnamic acid hydroxylase [Actinomadura latina]